MAMPSDRARNYLPKHIHVGRHPQWPRGSEPCRTDTLLDLEQERDELMARIFDERAKVLRVQLENTERISHWENSEYWHIALPQALFDMLGHYNKRDVRRVCLAWLLWNSETFAEFSPSVAVELQDLLKQQERLTFDDGAYSFKTGNAHLLAEPAPAPPTDNSSIAEPCPPDITGKGKGKGK